MSDVVEEPAPFRRSMVAFVKVLSSVGSGVLENLLLTVALGLTEWVGMMLLLPLLALVGVRDSGGSVTQLVERFAILLGSVGLEPSLPVVLTIFALLVALRAMVQRRSAIAATTLEQDVVHHLRQRLLAAVSMARWEHLSTRRMTDFSHAMTSELDRVSLACSQLIRLVAEVGVGVAYVAIAIRVSITLTLLAAVVGVFLAVCARSWNARANATGHELGIITADFFSALHEHLGGLKVARANGAVDRNIDVVSRLAERMRRCSVTATGSYASSVAFFNIFSALVLALLLWVAVSILHQPAAAVLVLLFVFARLVPRFSSSISAYQYLMGSMPAFDNVIRCIESCERNQEPASAFVDLPRMSDGVELCDVTFRYRADQIAPTIDGVTLNIRARQTTAIVGASGAGKSTVADLVLCLLTAERGSITVDAKALDASSAPGWRAQVGYVSQDTFLFHDTVRANLLWARPQATEHDVAIALEQAAAAEFVNKLPNGLDTVVGDRGVLLSGGERQRLALARAMLRRPVLMILDEATSALDSENERRVQDAIAQLHGEMAILIISHRLSAIRNADAIYVLDAGRVIESGTFQSLLALPDSRFRDLCLAQGVR